MPVFVIAVSKKGLPMINLLASLVLVFTSQQTPDPCSGFTPGSVNPPAATPCLTPGVMDWDCVAIADEKYKNEVANARKQHCQKQNAIIAELEAALAQCNTDYSDCLAAGTPAATCMSNRLDCRYQAKRTALDELYANDAELANEEAIAAAAHAARTAICCRHDH